MYACMQNYIRRMPVSPLYLSSEGEPSWLHHSNNIVSQMSLNHGVKMSPGSWNICFNSCSDTYFASRTSLGLTFRSTSAWIKRI